MELLIAQPERVREEETRPTHPLLQLHLRAVRPPLPIAALAVELGVLPLKAHVGASTVRSITTVLDAKVLVGLAPIVQVQRPVVMPKII